MRNTRPKAIYAATPAPEKLLSELLQLGNFNVIKSQNQQKLEFLLFFSLFLWNSFA